VFKKHVSKKGEASVIINSLPKGLLLALVFLSIVNGESGLPCTVRQANTAESEAPSLQLTAKILNQEYCVGDSELDGLRLKLRLIYTNKSKQQLILYKGSRLVCRIMISRDFAEAAANHFAVNSSLTQLMSGGEDCYKGAAPSKCFVVLPPGASYETEGIAGTFAVRGDVREIAGAVKSGDHVLQIQVITWDESDEIDKKLRVQWLRHGLLWYEPITSAPVPFTVPRERKIVDCP
jgi:hypothetical protein